MGNPTPSRDAMNLAADIAEKFVLADFGGNDIAGLRNGIMADAAIADFVQSIAQIRADAYEQAAKIAATQSVHGIGQAAVRDAIVTAIRARALSDQPDSTNEGLATVTHGGLAGELSVLLARYRKPYSTASDAFALRSHMVAHVDEIIAALSTGRQA